jgi:hypothetical protein
MVLSIIYLGFTAWAIYYALTCTEFLCSLVIFLPGLPWIYLFQRPLDELSKPGLAIVTVIFAFLNLAILYVLLSLVPTVFRRG